MKPKVPTALIILDGFGYSTETEYNAVYHAKTPCLDRLMKDYSHTFLRASGPAVGLPDGYAGNSEVGHLTIGSGRIVPQPATFIHKAVEDRSFFDNPVLRECLERIGDSGASLHIMGLLSDAGVHSDSEDIYAILDVAYRSHIKNVFIHAFLDGRDAPPRSAANYLEQLDAALTNFEYGSIGSIHGRFYAMDRDNNWQRTEQSYRVLAWGNPCTPVPWEDILEEQYAQGITDEFIAPTQLDPTSTIQNGDGIVFINFREDRARQLTAAFVDPQFTAFKTKQLNLSCFVTPIAYGPSIKTTVLFEQEPIENTLRDVLAAHGKTIFSIAETEKYAHITYFFSGKKEAAVLGETRMLIQSIKAKNYIDTPCMSAPAITAAVCASVQGNPCDFYLINYANADMVGHSGDFDATVKAIECLDEQLGILYDTIVQNMNGTMYITADHGNAEQMYDLQSHQPKTSHTMNDIPFVMITKNGTHKQDLPINGLADIAPFILTRMGLPIPQEMKKLLFAFMLMVQALGLCAAHNTAPRSEWLIVHEDLKPWVLDYDVFLRERLGLSLRDVRVRNAAEALKQASISCSADGYAVETRFRKKTRRKRKSVIEAYNFHDMPGETGPLRDQFRAGRQSLHAAMQDPALFVKYHRLLNHRAYNKRRFPLDLFLLDIKAITQLGKRPPEEYLRYYVHEQISGGRVSNKPALIVVIKAEIAKTLAGTLEYTQYAQELLQDSIFSRCTLSTPIDQNKMRALEGKIIAHALPIYKQSWSYLLQNAQQGISLAAKENDMRAVMEQEDRARMGYDGK